mmetsp:Transcript_3409/g.11178  ORF Transcript_3409/g.11178 Transcript_3409/m.11178 type:complete len:547 (-) Transcript_3409:13-1653(-)
MTAVQGSFLCTCLIAFESRAETELSTEVGEELRMLAVEGPFVVARNALGRVGLVPRCCVTIHLTRKPLKKGWKEIVLDDGTSTYYRPSSGDKTLIRPSDIADEIPEEKPELPPVVDKKGVDGDAEGGEGEESGDGGREGDDAGGAPGDAMGFSSTQLEAVSMMTEAGVPASDAVTHVAREPSTGSSEAIAESASRRSQQTSGSGRLESPSTLRRRRLSSASSFVSAYGPIEVPLPDDKDLQRFAGTDTMYIERPPSPSRYPSIPTMPIASAWSVVDSPASRRRSVAPSELSLDGGTTAHSSTGRVLSGSDVERVVSPMQSARASDALSPANGASKATNAAVAATKGSGVASGGRTPRGRNRSRPPKTPAAAASDFNSRMRALESLEATPDAIVANAKAERARAREERRRVAAIVDSSSALTSSRTKRGNRRPGTSSDSSLLSHYKSSIEDGTSRLREVLVCGSCGWKQRERGPDATTCSECGALLDATAQAAADRAAEARVKKAVEDTGAEEFVRKLASNAAAKEKRRNRSKEKAESTSRKKSAGA